MRAGGPSFRYLLAIDRARYPRCSTGAVSNRAEANRRPDKPGRLVQPSRPTHSTLWLDVWARGGDGEEAVVANLLRALRPRLTALSRDARLDAVVRARVQVEDSRPGVQAALERAGFTLVRTSLQIVVEDPAWPEPRCTSAASGWCSSAMK